MINERKFEVARNLLDDDKFLMVTVRQELENSRRAILDLLSGLNILMVLQSCLSDKLDVLWPELYILALSGSLLEDTILNNLLDELRNMTSEQMTNLLSLVVNEPSLPSDLITALTAINRDIEKLIGSLANDAAPLRSIHDIRHSTLRTTVVAQKVSLSKNASKHSAQDMAYTEIIDRLHDVLVSSFQTVLINPADLFLHEILIFDSKSPHRENLAPNPRSAIERALSIPHDYLDCECCSFGDGARLEASQPATVVLYQLYLESGSAINAADLWEAFWTIVGEKDEDDERERALAFFSRSLAELKYLGMVKNSKKKADHLQKLAWKGL